MNKAGELIFIHIGQAGCEIGREMWDLFCHEHGVTYEGKKKNNEDCFCESVFIETSSGNYITRSLFIDCDPIVIDELGKGKLKYILNSGSVIKGKEGSSDNFARGYNAKFYFKDDTLDKIRTLVEACSRLQGFIITHSISGGTGSGFAKLVYDEIRKEHTNIPIVGFIVCPSPNICGSVVEAYNSLLFLGKLNGRDYEGKGNTLSILFDNEALYSTCSKLSSYSNESSYYPTTTLKDINKLISQSISSATFDSRFSRSSTLGLSLRQLVTNLVPFKNLTFGIPSYAPMLSPHEKNKDFKISSVSDLTNQVFDSSYTMLSIDTAKDGKYISNCLNYRGEVSPSEIQQSLLQLRGNDNLKFCDWDPKILSNKKNPNVFRCGINLKSPSCPFHNSSGKNDGFTVIEKDVSNFCNSTAISKLFKRMVDRSASMYCKMAFVHWYCGEGMEQYELSHAQDDIFRLELDYNDIELQKDT